MSRVRQFGQVRESRKSETTSLSTKKQQRLQSVRRNLICVNCVNKSLSKQKHMKNLIEKEQQNRPSKYQIKDQKMNFSHQQSPSRNKKIHDNYRVMTQYNTEVIKVHSSLKELQKAKKMHEKKQIQDQREKLLKERENAVKRQKALKQKWYNELKEQMAVKQQQKQKEKQQKLQKCYLQQQNMFKSLNKNRQKQRNQIYQNELREQIKINQIKKQVQKEEQIKANAMNSNYLLDWAEERQKKLLQQQMDKKRLLWQQSKEKQDKIEMKKQEKQRQDQKTRQQIMKKENYENQRIQLINKMRQTRMSEYMKEVKQQIYQKEIMKKTQKQEKLVKFQQTFYTNSNRKKQLMACHSCQKQYPKNYLSQFQSNS